MCAGHGQETALFVAESLPATLYRHVALKIVTDSIRAALTSSYAESTELLRNSVVDVSRWGTACLSLLQVEKTLICANVEDCRAVVGRKSREYGAFTSFLGTLGKLPSK